jgi:hypothetical protein
LYHLWLFRHLVPEPAPRSVPFVQCFLLHFATNSIFSVALLLCRLALSRRALTLAQFSVATFINASTDGRRMTCEPERKRLPLAVVLEYLSAEALELALVKATIRGHSIHLQVPYRKARGPIRRMPSDSARFHRTSTGLTGHWNDRPNSRKNKSTGHQRKTFTSK